MTKPILITPKFLVKQIKKSRKRTDKIIQQHKNIKHLQLLLDSDKNALSLTNLMYDVALETIKYWKNKKDISHLVWEYKDDDYKRKDS